MERAQSEIPGCELTLTAETVLEVRELTKHFPVYEKGVILRRKLGDVHAVDQVSFDIKKNETFGLVGESGCGKTTIAKCMLYLEPPTSGEILFNEKNITEIFKKARKDQVLALRRQMQYIFQNPYSSLDPRMTVADIIMEPLEVHKHIPRNEWQDRRTPEDGRIGRLSRGKISARVQWGPEAESLHSSCAGRRSAIHRGGRASCVSRCFGSGTDSEPASRASAKTRHNVPLHFTRSKYRQTHLSQSGGHVSWKDS